MHAMLKAQKKPSILLFVVFLSVLLSTFFSTATLFKPDCAYGEPEQSLDRGEDLESGVGIIQLGENVPETSQPTLSDTQTWMIADNNGIPLAGSNELKECNPASITKVMTAMVALDAHIPADELITIPQLPTDWDNAQLAGFEPGSVATFNDLMTVMLVYSANDAAYSIACAIGGSEENFAELMNQKAARLGMEHSHFVNASGMAHDGHYSCAFDLCRMGRYAITNYDFIRATVRKQACTIVINGTEKTYYATDHLFGVYTPIIGIKTGALNNEYMFLGAAESDNLTLYSCVLQCSHEQGRFSDTETLFNWAYNNYYSRITFAVSGQQAGYAPFAWRFGYRVTLTYPNTAQGYINQRQHSDAAITANRAQLNHYVVPGTSVGYVTWREKARLVAEANVIATQQVTQNPPYNPLAPRLGFWVK